MNLHTEIQSPLHTYRFICGIAMAECLVFLFSGTGFYSLAANTFFSLPADPLYWLFYITGIPQFIIAHTWAGLLADALIVFFFVLVIFNPGKAGWARGLFFLLILYYLTLTGYLAHRNYQVGFFVVLVPLLFHKNVNRRFGFEAIRYFLLFFYFSAALLKLRNHAFQDIAHFSEMVSGQFAPYYLEANTGWRTGLNLYLAGHPQAGYSLYLLSFLLEIITVFGFFTRRFDKWIATALLVFHAGDWIVMDIAPFGQLAFICILFTSDKWLRSKRPEEIIL